ncbi:MAG: V-type ATP synthase subunit E [Spirochaetaceae bacterium]|nr:MAG: V-type ATP synthase subunit E [Spirochaetaceae bacterium]
METQLQELLDKIQKQGVDEARQKANTIEEQARTNAKKIMDDAKKEADGIVNRAKQEAASLDASGREALAQAGRDLVLRLKEEIKAVFDTVIKAEVGASLTTEALGQMIALMVDAWVKKGVTSLELLLSKDDAAKMEKHLRGKLSAELLKGVVIRPVPNVEAGFRIMEKDGASYVNLTDEGLAEILQAFLNPRLGRIISGAKEGK